MKATRTNDATNPEGPPKKSAFMRHVHTLGQTFRSALRKAFHTVSVIFKGKNRVHPTISITDFLEESSSEDSLKTQSESSTNPRPVETERTDETVFHRPWTNLHPDESLSKPAQGYSEPKEASKTLQVFPETYKPTNGIVRLPHGVRCRIYSYLSPTDIMSLRLVNKTTSKDVSKCRGLRLIVNDCLANYDWIKNVSLEGIAIDYWCDPLTPKSIWLSSDGALAKVKTINIRGTIIPANLQPILQASSKLECLEVQLTQFNIKLQPDLFMGMLPIPKDLRELKVTVLINTHEDASLSLKNMKSLLMQIKRCYKLHVLSFQIVFRTGSNEMDEFNLICLKFIRSYAPFLSKINVAFKMILHEAAPQPRESIGSFMEFKTWIDKLQLQHLTLALDKTYLEWWKPLLLSQRNLKTLELNLKGQLWTTISGTVLESRNSLERLSLSSINLPRKSGRELNLVPLHLSCFKECSRLKELSIIHLESNAPIVPFVRGTQELPVHLTSLEMKHLILKPYQTLVFLLKLPSLQKLTLGHWTESEKAFGSFLITVTFLVLFELTSIHSFELVETKRKVENRNVEVNKMKEALHSKANIHQEDTLTESILKITVRSEITEEFG